MKLSHILLGVVAGAFVAGNTPVISQVKSDQLTLQDINKGVYYPRSAGSGFRSLRGAGSSYMVISPDHKRVVRYSYATGKEEAVLFDTAKARECPFETFDDYLISDNGFHMIILRETTPIYRRSRSYTAYHYDVRRNMISPLSETKGQVRIPTFSPDGKMCAYVIDNDLYIKKFDYDTEVRVTTDGKRNHVMNGVTDWVYEEELYLTSLLSWSPDSKYLSYAKTDESAVKMIGMTMYGKGNYPFTYAYKYPKAGEQNSRVSLWLYEVDNRRNVPIMEKELGEEELYIPRLGFEGEQLYVFTLNRNQNDLRIYRVNPGSRIARLWLQDKDDRYIDEHAEVLQMQITPSAAFLVSERDGRPRVYKYTPEGNLVGRLTDEDADVEELYGVSPSGEVYYQLASPTPMDRVVVARDAKGRTRLLSPDTGTGDVTFSDDMSYYLLSHSSSTEAPRYTIHRTKDGKELRVLEDNAALAQRISRLSYGTREFITLETESGQRLNGWIMRPTDYREGVRYPVVMTQYSGPGSQSALNHFSFGWEEYLTTQGFVVACIDGRGTGGRGSDFEKCTYLRMGYLESQDQIEAAHALAKLPYVDGDRIGIFGWSFGGYNVLMTMARGKGTFRAGVAVAPPYDWRLYDTIYTERYMRTPQENPKGYEQTSVATYIKGMEGALLICHGTADDNVHFQNTMHLVPALVEADKDFRMLVYPDKNHGIYGGNTRNHLYRQITNHFITYLRP